jgi:hypothetical protein
MFHNLFIKYLLISIINKLLFIDMKKFNDY